MKNYLFTSESVTEGHPDKLCDRISDSILDAYLAKDPKARVACEVTAATGIITVMGEITAKCVVDIAAIVRDTIRQVGYTENHFGFDADSCAVVVNLNTQSPDIAMGVDNGSDIGAGDQGMMFGYATDETSELMPLPAHLAHRLAQRLTAVRKDKVLPYLGPDGKTQVTVEYSGNSPVRIDTVIISTQHTADVEQETIREDMLRHVISEVLPKELIDKNTRYFINPTGRFVVGGPQADTGLTGRKIIVDTYGGSARHGGGAFSGKDPTKVDRSASYATRYIAKNLVAAGVAKRLEVQVAYAIGVAEPVSVSVNTFGTGVISNSEILTLIQKHFDLRPAAIIEGLKLRRPIYKDTSAYGHFGRTDICLPWEQTDKADLIKEDLHELLSGN